MPHRQNVELNLPLAADFLPIATSCAEKTAQAYGMGRTEAMHLMLAVEEVYSFLSARLTISQQLKLRCRNGRYYTEIACRFPRHALPVGAFNITSTVSADDEQSLAEMGLLLAARTVDHLAVLAKNDEMEIRFLKNRQYPEFQGSVDDFEPQGDFSVVESTTELLKQFAIRVATKYGPQAPAFFRFPGKVADMVVSGEYSAVLLADGRGNLGAGMFWRNGRQMAEAMGPYVFCNKPQLAVQIVEECLRKLARTSALCIVVQQPTADMPPGYFEPLAPEEKVLYRQLEEDNGTQAYVHPDFADYLKESYQRLFLPRNIHRVESQGELQSPHSAFAVRMDRPAGRVVMESLWVGEDASAIMRQHIQALRREGFRELLFHLDTGVPEQAMLSPALSLNGFRPCWIVPWGGRGDILVLAHRQEESP